MYNLRSKLYSILFLALLGIVFVNGFSSGIDVVVSNLPAFQSEEGGFVYNRDSEPTLDATAQALFLSSLFGGRSKINTESVSNFLESQHNSDNGFGNRPGQASDLESTRNAILSYNHLGKAVSNPEAVGTFIHSLYDRDSKLYANNVGDSGDLKSTALAFQCFANLNLLQTPDVTDKLEAIKKNLQSLIKTASDKRTKYFSSITADNYYAIVVAYYAGIEFGDVTPWALYFFEQQAQSGQLAGGFYSDKERSEINVEDASHSLSALYFLQKASKSENNLVESVNTELLMQYASGLPRSLYHAYHAYVALARLRSFQSIFKITTQYDVLNPRFKLVGHRIIQGTQVKPVLNVKSSFGQSHAGLDVSVTITHPATGDKKTVKLAWNADSQTYVTSDVYTTADKLGDLNFEYVIRWLVADLGDDDIVLEVQDRKAIGYDLAVTSKAVHAGKSVDPNGVVGFGTEFSFDVRLGTEKQPKLTSGDFDVIFTVRDSSQVAIYEKKQDCRKATGPIKFDFTLENSNIPSGELRFDFSVSNEKGIHTSESITYSLPVTMVATEITFEGFGTGEVPKYQIGDNIKVAMTPASLPDLRTVQYYATEDTHGNKALRRFYMFVATAENAVLFTLSGNDTIVDGRIRYSFNLPVNPIFDAIGTKHVSFHYETANGNIIELQNYDSKAGELFDDSTHLTYNVNTELHLSEVKNAPKNGNLDYGNEVKFSFKVKDTVSGKYVFAGSEASTVYLALKHKEEGRATPFTSSKVTAEQIRDDRNAPNHFQIAWSVNPNAVKGKGHLELFAEGADGKEIPIQQENSKEHWTVQVEVGGQIDVEENVYSSVVGEQDTVFFVEFGLTCQKKRLNDAQLKATVSLQSTKGDLEEVFPLLPVTHGTQQGYYQVSWLQDKTKAKPGKYVVDFYREVDRHRLSAEELKPFFTVSLNYEPDTGSPLPVKTEVLVAFILGAAFLYTSLRKLELESNKRNQKKKK